MPEFSVPQYKIVPMRELMAWPSDLTQYPQYDEEFTANLAAALKEQAGDGWELVTIYAFHHHSGPGYAIFRRSG
jgi:hypothetical protein